MPLLILLHVTWGLPQTLAGLVVLAMNRRAEHKAYCGACVTTWGMRAGLSLGPFVFVPRDAPSKLVVHECGHTVQSLILGPLYVPVVVVPSLIWAGVPALHRWRRAHRVSYYALPTERWANTLGEWHCKEPSMGQALID